jgi:hypothetical protein
MRDLAVRETILQLRNSLGVGKRILISKIRAVHGDTYCGVGRVFKLPKKMSSFYQVLSNKCVTRNYILKYLKEER